MRTFLLLQCGIGVIISFPVRRPLTFRTCSLLWLMFQRLCFVNKVIIVLLFVSYQDASIILYLTSYFSCDVNQLFWIFVVYGFLIAVKQKQKKVE